VSGVVFLVVTEDIVLYLSIPIFHFFCKDMCRLGLKGIFVWISTVLIKRERENQREEKRKREEENH
jgi:hypothetical protein